MKKRAQVKIGLVLPEAYFGSEEWKNAQMALRYVDEAAEMGAELVCFPEGYPGPATGPFESEQLSFEPIEALCQKAKEHGVFVVASNLEKNPATPDTYFLTLKMISREGEIIANYRRMQPDTPPLNAYLYNGRAHILPGDEFMVVDTDIGAIGLAICSELFVPEIPRILMLRGAEILIAPMHGAHSPHCLGLKDTWRCIARARAAENLCYVLVTRNLYKVEGFDYRKRPSVGAIVAGPEEMVAVSEKPGVLLATLDMDRLDWLRCRNYDEENLSRPESPAMKRIGCRPGQIYERRPELYQELARPHDFSYDYSYPDESLDAWEQEYDRIYKGGYREIRNKHGEFDFG